MNLDYTGPWAVTLWQIDYMSYVRFQSISFYSTVYGQSKIALKQTLTLTLGATLVLTVTLVYVFANLH